MDYITSESIISLFLSAASDVHHGRKTIKAARAHIAKNMHAYTEQVIGSHVIERIRFYADRVANTKTSRKTAFWDLMMALTIEVREEARAIGVAHNEALIVNEAYDNMPECPNGNRLIHAVESVFGKLEAYSWCKEAGSTGEENLEENFKPVVYVDPNGVKYDYTEIDGQGEIARYDETGEWFLVCKVSITNPTPESIAARLPGVVNESEDRVIALQITGEDGVKYEYNEDSDGLGHITELVGDEWCFVILACIPVPTAENIWKAVPRSYQADWGRFTLKVRGRHYQNFKSAADARDAYCQMRDDSGEGAHTWSNGAITDGRKWVFLSYNGRAWASDIFLGQETILTYDTKGF